MNRCNNTILSYKHKHNINTEERLQNMVKSSHGKDDNRDLAEGLKMRTLSRLLLFVFPPFGIMYILRLTELIDRDSLLIGENLTFLFVFHAN